MDEPSRKARHCASVGSTEAASDLPASVCRTDARYHSGGGVACQEEFLAAGHAVRSSLARRLLYPPEGFHHKEEKSVMDKIAL